MALQRSDVALGHFGDQSRVICTQIHHMADEALEPGALSSKQRTHPE